VKPTAETFEVRTAIEVNAPPEKGLESSGGFCGDPAAERIAVSCRIAYPIRAEISGHGAGAMRQCISRRAPLRNPSKFGRAAALKFGRDGESGSLNELSPYGNIQPAHLHVTLSRSKENSC